MKAFKFISFALFTFSLGLAGCDETPIEPAPEEVKSEIIIDAGIITNGLSFTNDEGEKSISFSTNKDWTLNIATTPSGEKWCTASVIGGAKGNAVVDFTVTKNTSYDNRSVSVTIKSGTATKTFTISQKGVDALLITTNKYEVSPKGGTVEIEVKSNIEYEMEIADNAKDWITESTTKTRSLSVSKHSFKIAASEDLERREGEIYFKSGDKLEIVKVYQASAGALILLSRNEYNVNSKGETITVDLRSNCEYEVEMPDVEWLMNVPKTRAMSSHTLQYEILPNETYDNRDAQIVFKDINETVSDTLYIIQAQKDAIIVAKNEYIVESFGGDLVFDVNANVDFEVSVSEDWIKQRLETRALVPKTLNFTIDENSLEEDREGLISISADDLKQNIKILQKRKVFFNFSKTEVNITSEGEEFTIEVNTNGGYYIKMPQVNWLTQGEIYSTSTNTYINKFIVATNTTCENRTAEIEFHNSWNDEVVLVKVCQAQGNVLHISSNEYSIDANGGTINVELKTNVDYNISTPETVSDWVSLVGKSELDTYTYLLTFNINANEDKKGRTAEILIKDRNSDLQVLVFISQSTSYYVGDIVWNDSKGYKQFIKDGYKAIDGNLTIDNIKLTDTLEIKEITGDFTIYCGNITNSNLGHFYSLKKIGGDLNIKDKSKYYTYESYPSAVSNFAGLKNLESIGGDFNILGSVSDKVWYKDYTYGNGESGITSDAFWNLETIELDKLQSIGGSLIVKITYNKVTPRSTWHSWGTRTNDYGRAFKSLKSVIFNSLVSVGGEINIDDIFRDIYRSDVDIQINLPY